MKGFVVVIVVVVLGVVVFVVFVVVVAAANCTISKPPGGGGRYSGVKRIGTGTTSTFVDQTHIKRIGMTVGNPRKLP